LTQQQEFQSLLRRTQKPVQFTNKSEESKKVVSKSTVHKEKESQGEENTQVDLKQVSNGKLAQPAIYSTAEIIEEKNADFSEIHSNSNVSSRAIQDSRKREREYSQLITEKESQISALKAENAEFRKKVDQFKSEIANLQARENDFQKFRERENRRSERRAQAKQKLKATLLDIRASTVANMQDIRANSNTFNKSER
jgi:hypothetical protein